MKYTTLPNTDIKVSKICLGTMTFGNQNTEAEGHHQLDYAIDQGVNFIDTAELYPVPANAETQGATSRIIGTWNKKPSNREKVVIASKIAGPGDYTAHVRTTGFSPKSIEEAINLELKRLQTDYIDLYQLHWPERETNYFGQRDYKHNPKDTWEDNFNEILHTLSRFIKAGKIREIGVSNERSWGMKRYLEESRINSLPRISTIQNPYSLLNRTFESDLAEMSLRENVGLLAYSPLASGSLSGKYIGGKLPKNSRFDLFPRFAGRYNSPQALEATKRYFELAKDHGLSLTQMALAFVNQQPFITGNIIGATTMEQLKENIASIDVNLTGDLINQINAIHNAIPNPAP